MRFDRPHLSTSAINLLLDSLYPAEGSSTVEITDLDPDDRTDDRSDDVAGSGAEKMFGDFAPALVSFRDDVLLGQVWTRTKLSAKERSLITIACLTTSGKTPSNWPSTSTTPARTAPPRTN